MRFEKPDSDPDRSGSRHDWIPSYHDPAVACAWILRPCCRCRPWTVAPWSLSDCCRLLMSPAAGGHMPPLTRENDDYTGRFSSRPTARCPVDAAPACRAADHAAWSFPRIKLMRIGGSLCLALRNSPRACKDRRDRKRSSAHEQGTAMSARSRPHPRPKQHGRKITTGLSVRLCRQYRVTSGLRDFDQRIGARIPSPASEVVEGEKTTT